MESRFPVSKTADIKPEEKKEERRMNYICLIYLGVRLCVIFMGKERR